MSGVSSDPVEMAALGRPFKVGMLYDCRNDKLVPGITLWDHEDLTEDTAVTPKPNSEFKVVASESFSDKSSSLGVEASLKAGFYGGLIKVGGSAKYLNDKKTSKRQARVTLQYKTTTEFKELTMNHLGRGNIKYPYVFEKGLATHVVTAILYGAQAFFVFDQEVSESEDVTDVQGKLQVLIKKFPSITIEGDGALQMNEEEREKVSRFSCTFHGDFNLSQSPVTFEDAVKVYQELPSMLGPDGEKAVPVKVWLLPLTSLDSTAAKLVRHISVGLVLEVERTLEYFEDLEMRCQDLSTSAVQHQLPQLDRKIRTFQQLCSAFSLEYQATVAKKLPSIRGGGEEEAELATVLEKRATSPFSSDCLDYWLRCKVKEIHLIKTYRNLLRNSQVVSSQTELDERLFNMKTAVCFVFTSLENEEPFLRALDKFMKGDQSDEAAPRASDIKKEQWYSDRSVREAVRQRAKLFGDFAEANQDNEDLHFLVVGFKDERREGAAIYVYEDGFEDNDNFEPPSKPNKVKVQEVTPESVTVRFSGPSHGAAAVTGFRLEHREAGVEWEQQNEANPGTVTITDLTPDTEYSFRVRALTAVGLGPVSEITSVKTAPDPEGARLAEELRKQCEVLKTKGPLDILRVPLTKDELNIKGCARYVFGKDSLKPHCTIIVMGATGAGKSTLINAMINYVLGVEWADPFRFKLVVEKPKSQTESQTSEVTVYKVNFEEGFTVDYSLTIIDTPGYGDTRGISRDQQITEQIRTLFTNNCGVDDIHAICFVVQSSSARLSATQRYIFDSILSIFGSNVAENIRVLVTFADNQLPPVLEAIRKAEVPCPEDDDGQLAHYKFNNSAVYADNQTPGFDQMFWEMGKASMKTFFNALHRIEPKSLTLTKEVLQERKRLEEAVDDIQRKVKEGLEQLDKIKQTEDQIKEHEAEIDRNEDFVIKVKVTKALKKDISQSGKYNTNCQVCHRTCHYPCDLPDDRTKHRCWAMGRNKFCRECPKKCFWNKHFNQRYNWEYRAVTEERTVKELKENYFEALDDKKSTEKLLSKLKTEYERFKKDVAVLVTEATALINRLKAIALIPNPLSARDYIDLLIEAEKKRREAGWKQRIKTLEEMRDKVDIMETLDKGGRIL